MRRWELHEFLIFWNALSSLQLKAKLKISTLSSRPPAENQIVELRRKMEVK